MMYAAEDQKRLWSRLSFPRSGLKSILNLYRKYADELKVVKEFQSYLYSRKDRIGLVPQLGDMEAEITYLKIRECKPETVVEISPASGWSTTWILHALKANKSGNLFSYDLVDDSVKIVPGQLSESRWEFIQGDVRDKIEQLPDKIDYLFLDSDHSSIFAMWYIKELFPRYNDLSVSVHDILKDARDPGWGPESLVLCDWLGQHKIPCQTVSRALKNKGYDKVLKVRKKLKVDSVIHPPDYNSMIYFDL